MRKLTCIVAALVTMVASSSCTVITADESFHKEQEMPDRQLTLERNNFRVTATQAVGESKGFAFLGFQFKSPTTSEALRNLYKNSGAMQPGRANQLINKRKEAGFFTAFIFTRPFVRVYGDVVEFVN